nr:hypothetical protein [Streptomyces sp. STCH 565 A]
MRVSKSLGGQPGATDAPHQDGGRRAGSLEEARFTGIEHLEFDL